MKGGGLHLVLLLCNVWDHLKDNVFNRLKHYCLEGGKCWLNFSVMAWLLRRNYSETSFLKVISIYF